MPAASTPAMIGRQRRDRRSRGPRAALGMALIEVLVSILIFSFGVLGLIGLEASAVNFSVDAEDRNRAALFASDIASTMWLANSVDTSATGPLSAQYATWKANIGVATAAGVPGGSLTITTVAGTTNAADILITWTPTTDQTGQTRSLTTRVVLP